MKKPKELSIFEYKTYRKFILDWIESKEQPRGLMRKLAEAARCETSHMSRALSGQLDLTPDQAFRLSQFFRMNDLEQKYFLKLLDYERTGDAEFKQLIDSELKQMLSKHQNLSERFKETSVTTDGSEMLYYSSWHWSAIHVIVGIPEYQTTKKISERLGLSEPYVQSTLQALENFGIIKKENGKWKMTNKHFHLSKNSPMNAVNLSNWRQRAVLKAQELQNENLNYSIVQTVSKEDYETIRKLFIKTIDEYRAIANPSKEEELVCFNIDFFKV